MQARGPLEAAKVKWFNRTKDLVDRYKPDLLYFDDTVPPLGEPGSVVSTPATVPPLGAEPDRLTVQESPSAPVMEVLLQEIALTVGATAVPVPLRLTVTAGALLESVRFPDTELAAVGEN